MKKFKSMVGYIVYEATAEDTQKLGGRGKCDHCDKFSETGFLVAVLNSYLCAGCYKEWDDSSRMYTEDLPVERRHEAYYDSVFQIQG
jgi:hypothetical protein